MKFSRDDAVTYIPDGQETEEALHRTTHLGIGAHQDDLEIMAIGGILKCYQHDGQWFSGVVVSDGAGAPRSGAFADYTNEQMVEARIVEQNRAADIGEYAAQFILLHPSEQLKDAGYTKTADDLEKILRATSPSVVYTHNLMDKHYAHVAVALRLVDAIRRLPKEDRPEKLYGCEVWRDLDWLPDADKVVFDCTERQELQLKLLEVFETQIGSGKRYDLAAMGRRRANATYLEPHQVDEVTGAVFGVDMTPLIEDNGLSPLDYAVSFTQRLTEDVHDRIQGLR